MLVPNQMVEVHWCPANKEHYENKKYEFSGYRKALLVRAEDLMPNSTIKVKVKCDYCGNEYITQYKLYLKGIANLGKNACKSCNSIKIKEANLNNWGVENPFASKEIQNKIKKTNLKKYGFENPSKSNQVKEKIAETNLQKYGNVCTLNNQQIHEKAQKTIYEKYGVNSVFQNKDIQKRIKDTLKNKYGVEYVSQIPEVMEKVEQTNLKRRGVKWSCQDPEVIKKMRQTLSQNHTVPTSKAERVMCERLQNLFGKENCYPSYPFDRITFDCLVKINDIKIDVEYDGMYWHKDRQEKDKRRNYYVIKKGIKVLRFQANNETPNEQQLEEAIQELVKSSRMLKIIKLDV